jgi:hypothetical protein
MDGLVTAAEATARLGLSRTVVHKWMRRGLITPVRRVARAGLFRLEDVVACRDRVRFDRTKKPMPQKPVKGGAPPLAPEPTRTRPGSPERVAVYMERVRQGFAALHPGDTNVFVPCYLRRAVA